jgi:phosphoserine aminotransferase
MQKIYFTVGPSQLYPTVPKHTLNALEEDVFSTSHTSEFFIETYKSLTENLRKLFDIPSTHHVFFTGSSTESMHSIISSTVAEKSVHLITGGFSKKFYQAALDLHKKPQAIELAWDEQIDFKNLAIPSGAELLCITENDTSIGMQIPLKPFQQIKKANPSLLIAVDVVSSVPFVEIDYSYIDMAFFSVHKGLGLPAGLGILIANDAAIEKARQLSAKGISIGGHHSLVSLADKEATFKTPETPNVFSIYLLEKVTTDLLEQGIEVTRKETRAKADLIYEYFDAHAVYKPLIQGEYRSQTTPVISMPGKADEIAAALARQGLIVSKGYRPFEKDHLRIANFPAQNIDHIQRLIVAFDEVL